MNDTRNLRVLDEAYALVKAVHALARKVSDAAMPGWRDQVLRAVDSIPSNIAEGARRGTRKQFAHQLRAAMGSAEEVGVCLRIARAAGTISPVERAHCEGKRLVVSKMLWHLIRRVDEQIAREQNGGG
ncbi:MAG: four helix bundle protein [Gemmatimonadaceae bacterium]|nr:four helix bundle protein [Gemmatimonadaceae bacterium]